MNKTKIEWTDFTYNPVTGCWGPGGTAEQPKRCSYCYAQKMAQRIWAMQKRPLIDDPFMPMFWPERLFKPSKVKKPSKIFVCSMGELFGDWVPENWINAVIQHVNRCQHHTFLFLSKNPRRLKDFNPWPANCWVGTTVTNQADADERLPWLLQVEAPVRFVSHEPLISEIVVKKYLFGRSGGETYWSNYRTYLDKIAWAIIGAMTGPGAVKCDPAWVQGLIDQYRAAGVPIFVKGSLYKDFPIREWPVVGSQ